jgi:hypothetical protein
VTRETVSRGTGLRHRLRGTGYRYFADVAVHGSRRLRWRYRTSMRNRSDFRAAFAGSSSRGMRLLFLQRGVAGRLWRRGTLSY